MPSHHQGKNANRNRNKNTNRNRNRSGDSTREPLAKELAELAKVLLIHLSLAKIRAEQEKKQKEEKSQLLGGTFYATFDEVWRPEGAPYSLDDYMNMMRSGPPMFRTSGNDYFEMTLRHARNKDAVASDSSQESPTSYSTANTNAVEQGEGQVTRLPAAHIAHLVPTSSARSSLYHHIARWVFGLGNGELEPFFVQKLIHGSEENGMRASGTGLKHMPCNRIILRNQSQYYDKRPCLLIVPVLSLEQARDWQGQGYFAIAMMSSGSKDIMEGQPLEEVAGSLHMRTKGETATAREIAIARDLLETATKGMAFATLQLSNPTDDWVNVLKPSAQDMLKEVQDELFTAVGTSSKIIIPKTNEQGNQKPVRKIIFGPAFDTPPNSHPAPDPLLLLAKAALNWSMFHEQRLMAVGERDEK